MEGHPPKPAPGCWSSTQLDAMKHLVWGGIRKPWFLSCRLGWSGAPRGGRGEERSTAVRPKLPHEAASCWAPSLGDERSEAASQLTKSREAWQVRWCARTRARTAGQSPGLRRVALPVWTAAVQCGCVARRGSQWCPRGFRHVGCRYRCRCSPDETEAVPIEVMKRTQLPRVLQQPGRSRGARCGADAPI